ncbi:hypothetical protein [Nostoc sphaeroides]|uniref:Endonuclease n=1 Tax=Nostoc sphaeroides CCNUC1 TaxID=2653204 RepID=A0A5P8W4S9_9NOSO|nr:hypothetical protein [Nostoc sphaeroides]MCC5630095.1 hypothetical protein [Nostoc sphaeroides CHAB 2801]MCC5631479.1 hypothetical protein [Nostoc sphaeroides CHAB 2801]QFS47747.1 endonuclease [Nostoc sphaeroides CCNUC1]
MALAIAILWQVSVGGVVDAKEHISGVDELPPNHIARRNFLTQKKKPKV